MSYFDDEENYIIFGPKRRYNGDYREDPDTYNEEYEEPPNDRWETETGDLVFVSTAETRHLRNMANKLQRENRNLELLANIQAELKYRQDQEMSWY